MPPEKEEKAIIENKSGRRVVGFIPSIDAKHFNKVVLTYKNPSAGLSAPQVLERGIG
jgi:hypothetical protein